MSIEDILVENGYPVKNCQHYIQTAALYRGGCDSSSVSIYPEKNLVIDWVCGEKFSIPQLIARILGVQDEIKVKQYLKERSFILSEKTEFSPRLLCVKQYPKDSISRLVPNHKYWISRGISENIVAQFRGGECLRERFAQRYVFPIFSPSNDALVGFAGRSFRNSKIKWLLWGMKSFWVYPAFLNDSILKEKKEIILVEGIGDMLSLWECGIKNTLVIFGIEMCKAVLLYLLKISPDKIIISFNNNEENNAGINGSLKLKTRLEKYFNPEKIQILLPKECKDWNEELCQKGKQTIINQFHVSSS